MYQLLLVDDEATVLNGLQKFVDWNSLGFQIAGTAESAAEALAILRERKMDVLLTDVVMDRENGFDLVREAHRIHPDLKVVMLSGYDEFSYALEAIRLGAVNYLTKPLDFDQCTATFVKVRMQLDSEQAERARRIDLHQLRKEKFFRQFLETGEGSEEFLTYFSMARPLFGVVLLHFGRGKPVCEPVQMEKWFSGFMECYVLPLSSVDFCVLLSGLPPLEELHAQLGELLKKNPELSESAYLSLGGCTTDYRMLPTLCSRAKEAMKYRHLKDGDAVLSYDQLAPLFLVAEFDDAGFERRISRMLTEQDYEDARREILGQSARFLREEQPDLAGLTNLLLSVNRILAAQGFSPYKSDYDAFRMLAKTANTDEAAHFLEDFVQGSLKQFQTPVPDSGNFIINAALEYIQNHLDEKLTLATLSEITYVTPTYLSRLFHRVVGKHLADYLAELRIERSKKLLPDPSLKIYDIATLVGYDNAKHFSKVFQELTGMTPSEYRASKVERPPDGPASERDES